MPSRRSRSNDLRAMEAYRRIHATLGDRVVGPGADPAGDAGVGAPPPRPRQRPRPRPALPRSHRAAPITGFTFSGGGRSRGPGFDRPRPAGPVLTATAVIALLALLALGIGRLVVGSGGSGSPAAARTGGGRAASTALTAGRSTPTTSGARSTGHRSGAGRAGSGTPARTPAVISPRTSDASGATFEVPSASFTVQLATGAGACWVEVGPAASGPFSFVGTIAPGQQKAFPASNGLWIRLGAPGNVSVTVDGTPVQLGASGSDPYNLTFSTAGV